LAAAHKMARMIYFMLKNQDAYKDPGEKYYTEKYRERSVLNLKRRAASLGFEITPVQA